MNSFLEAILLGLLQGLTEFLPISSTGHLVLVESILPSDSPLFGLSFDAAIHLGTLLGLVVYFYRDIYEIALGLGRSLKSRRIGDDLWAKEAWLIIVATIPAVVAGLLLEKMVESIFRSPLLIASMLITFGVVMIVAEKLGTRDYTVKHMGLSQAIFVGIAQAVALIPGVSRSGVTISAGMFVGLKREAAARFTFLLSVPIVAGAGGKQLLDMLQGGLRSAETTALAFGLLSSAVAGYFTIKYLLKFLTSHRLHIFAYYRFLLAAIVFAVYFIGFIR